MNRYMPAFFLALIFSACGDGTREVDEGGGSAAVESFCRDWAKAACNDDVVRRCSAPDAAACETGQAAFCTSLVPASSYSRKNAEDCLDAVKAAYRDAELTAAERDTVLHLGPPCDRILSGPGGEGAACERTADCNTDEGLSCVIRPGAATGHCHEPEERGGGFGCAESHQTCAEGFYCDGRNCLARGAEQDECSATVPCGDELKCVFAAEALPEDDSDAGVEAGIVPDEESSGTCQRRAGLGRSCTVDDDCASGICERSPGSTSGVCAASIVLSTTHPVCEHFRPDPAAD